MPGIPRYTSTAYATQDGIRGPDLANKRLYDNKALAAHPLPGTGRAAPSSTATASLL